MEGLGDLGLSAEEMEALGLSEEEVAELGLSHGQMASPSPAKRADAPLSSTAPSPAEKVVQEENERYRQEAAITEAKATKQAAQKQPQPAAKTKPPNKGSPDRLDLGDIEAELQAALEGTTLDGGGLDSMEGGDMGVDADMESYLKELEQDEMKLDLLEKGDPESGWTLSLDAAAEVLKCASKNLAWLAVTWETEGEMGLRIVPRDVVGDARIGAKVAEVRPGMPKQLKAGLVFVALNGELIINLEYDQIMQKLFNSGRPLTVQFIVQLEQPFQPST